MKRLSGIFGFLVLALVVGTGYHFFSASRMGQRMSRQEVTSATHTSQLVEHEKDIGELDVRVKAHARRIVTLEGEMSSAQAEIVRVEEELNRVQEGAEKDQQRLDDLERDLATLRAEQATRDKEYRALKAFLETYELDTRRRLEQIEARLGLETPER